MRLPARAFFLLALTACGHAVPAADPGRGEGLYENHCTGCHDSVAHERENRKAGSPDELRAWVTQWSQHLELGWSAEDRDDVAAWLNGRFYRFPASTRQ